MTLGDARFSTVPDSRDSVPPPTAANEPPLRIWAARLFCENCEKDTPHRILRLVPRKGSRPGELRGVARCRECRWTHPFETVRPATVEVTEIVSEGPRSTRRRVTLRRGARVLVGSGVPGSDEPMLVHRIETRGGTSRPEALAEEISTLWVTPNVGAVVPVSVVEGARTRAVRSTWPPETVLEVGALLNVGTTEVRIVGLRALGRTWRHPGDRFRALEVTRVYGRRTDMPPAGRRDWSADRPIARSRASSTSRSERSRSGPGVRRTRTVPLRRSASGGAAVQRVSPS